MVKAICVGDLHLKMVPMVPKAWQISRYEQFINDLVDICTKKSAILVLAGDQLDSIEPRKEELKLFLYMLHRLNKANITTLLVSGNHETISKGVSLLDYLEVEKFPNIVYRRTYTVDRVKFYLLNHDTLDTPPKTFSKEFTNVLVTHVRSNVGKFIKEETDVASLVEPFDVCIAGDIHSDITTGKTHYTNSPLNKDFERTPISGYLEVTIDSGNKTVDRVYTNYPSLIYRRFEFSQLADFTPESEHFYKVDVEGTPEELRKVYLPFDNVRIHKIPKLPDAIASPAASEITPTLTHSVGALDDELVNYMKLLKYDEAYINDMMTEYKEVP